MRVLIRKLGRAWSVVVITIIGIILSDLITFAIAMFIQAFYQPVNLYIYLGIATLVPALAAPPCIWPVIDLLLKIEALEEEMRHQVTYDQLTGVYTRRAFMQAAKTYVDLAERKGEAFSALVIDLDRFKNINDRYGHAAGDEVLKSFSRSTEQVLRKSDIIGRTGGEEFAVILPNTNQNEAYELCERLHAKIRDSEVCYEEEYIGYTVSIGVAAFPGEKQADLKLIFRQADKALYMAKEADRNQTVLFE